MLVIPPDVVAAPVRHPRPGLQGVQGGQQAQPRPRGPVEERAGRMRLQKLGAVAAGELFRKPIQVEITQRSTSARGRIFPSPGTKIKTSTLT